MRLVQYNVPKQEEFMDNQPKRSSDTTSALRGFIIFGFAVILAFGGCAQMEKNGTWQSWANAMEK